MLYPSLPVADILEEMQISKDLVSDSSSGGAASSNKSRLGNKIGSHGSQAGKPKPNPNLGRSVLFGDQESVGTRNVPGVCSPVFK